MNTVTIPAKVSTDRMSYAVGYQKGAYAYKAEMTTAIQIIDGEHYTGAYTVTPGESEQVLQTSGLVMEQSVTVEAIPSNYGRITWDGSTLRVY